MIRWKVLGGACVAAILFGLILFEHRTGDPPTFGLVPLPEHIERHSGHFILRPEVRLVVDPGSRATGQYLAERLRHSTGYLVPVSGIVEGVAGNVTLTTSNAPAALGPEGYRLEIQPSGVLIRAPSDVGFFYGVQTLLQLLPPQIYAASGVSRVQWRMPCLAIEDRPRFPWRGYMLDVSRHFFSKREIKRVLDYMALHKLNRFHWHLTDDQGWRLEIKKYPRLTEVGAWRPRIGFNLDPKSSTAYGPDGRYGGFYTQEDVREIVAYAGARHISIVPEIELPGHATAALAAYPEFSCFPERAHYSTAGTSALDGVYCAGKDETFEFLQNVLAEVLELFPSEYIHIGGDEVSKQNWKQCPRCQARIRAEGLKDEAGLQSYFIHRIGEFLQGHGRTLIGWTEIRQGGLPENAAVMDWLGAAVDIANSGHDVVRTPNEYCYLDYYQSRDRAGEPPAAGGYLGLKKAYSLEPIPIELSPTNQPHILGAQGNLWTEYIPNLDQAEYMTFPRLCALSEVAWSPAETHSWDEFSERIKTHVARLEQLGIRYRDPFGR